MQWLRLYDDVLDDPKVQRLPPSLFKHWVNLLCLANKATPRGSLPAESDIAFRLRLGEDEVGPLLTSLEAMGLLEREGDAWKPHNWDGRQRSAEEMEAIHQARVEAGRRGGLAKASNRLASAKQPSSKRVADTDTDTEQKQIQNRESSAQAPPTPKTKRATAMTDDWEPFPAERAAMATELNMSHIEVSYETQKFRDHFIATGKPMKDWLAAWRNWMRRSREFAPRGSPGNGTKPEQRRPSVPRIEDIAHRYTKGGGG